MKRSGARALRLAAKRSGARPHHVAAAPGFTLIEAALGSLIVGTLFVAALHTVAASRTTHASQAARAQALLLAQSLMDEVLAQPYEDPDQTPVFGKEPGESAQFRVALDDIDDYRDYSVKPPRDIHGNAIASERFRHSCDVKRVKPSNLSGNESSDTGIKRITVTVAHADRVLVELTAYRTPADPWVTP